MHRYLIFLAVFSLLTVGCTSQSPQPTGAPQAIETPKVITDPTLESSTNQEVSATEEPAPATAPEPKRYTFVLVGGDIDRLGYATDTGSFVIFTAVFPKDEPGDIVVIDVPRDLYVPISCQDGTVDRIVTAYPIGLDAGDGEEDSGIDCVRQVVEDIFGLEVNSGVALVSGDAFESLINSFGGLTITPKSEHQARCGKSGQFHWLEGETYLMDGDIVKCYLKIRNIGAVRDQGRSSRAGQVAAAMAIQWLPLYVEHPVDSVVTSWRFWNENVNLSMSLAQAIRLAPLIPKAQDANIRSAPFRLDEDVSDWTTPEGISGLVPLVDLKEWAACMIGSPSDQDLERCLARVSTLP